MKPCGLFYLIQTATLLGSRFWAVSKIKAFTILIAFVSLYRESAVLKNIYFYLLCCCFLSKFTLSLLVARLYARSGLTKLVMLVSLVSSLYELNLTSFSVLVLNSSLNNRKSVLKSPPFSAYKSYNCLYVKSLLTNNLLSPVLNLVSGLFPDL
jgi:hypothetical protein